MISIRRKLRGGTGKSVVGKSLEHYQNADLDTAAEELGPSWHRLKSKPSVFYASIQGYSCVWGNRWGKFSRRSIKKYMADESAQTPKSCPGAFRKFIIFHTTSGEPPYAWYLAAVLVLFEHRRTSLLEESGEIVAKYKTEGSEKIAKSRKTIC